MHSFNHLIPHLFIHSNLYLFLHSFLHSFFSFIYSFNHLWVGTCIQRDVWSSCSYKHPQNLPKLKSSATLIILGGGGKIVHTTKILVKSFNSKKKLLKTKQYWSLIKICCTFSFFVYTYIQTIQYWIMIKIRSTI